MRILLFFLCIFGLNGPFSSHAFGAEAGVQNCNLPAPNVLTINSVTTNSVSATWSAVSGANEYYVTVEESASGLFAFSGYSASTSITVGGLQAATNYIFSVSAVDVSGCISPNAKTASFQTEYIIVDEIAGAFPAPTVPHGCGDQVPLPAKFGILNKGKQETVFIVHAENGILKVGHQNNDLGTTTCGPNGPLGIIYDSGWQFANEASAPPINGFDPARQINCFKLLNQSTTSCGFSLIGANIVLQVERFGAGVKLCYDILDGGGYQIVRETTAEFVLTDASEIEKAPFRATLHNPFSDVLLINFDSKDDLPVLIQMIDLNGKIVRFIKTSSTSKSELLNTDDLPAGIYFINIQNDRTVQTIKAIKQ